MAYVPAGTAIGNEDAVRQSQAAQFFYSFANILSGVDNEYVLDGSTRRDGLLGPTATLGRDIGVGVNGDLYLRGTAIAGGAPASIGGGAVAPGAASAFKVSTPMLVAAAVALYFLVK